jgi:hypothetical protein
MPGGCSGRGCAAGGEKPCFNCRRRKPNTRPRLKHLPRARVQTAKLDARPSCVCPCRFGEELTWTWTAGVEALGAKNWRKISEVYLENRRSDVQCLHR